MNRSEGNRPSLRLMILVPVLATIAVGFTVFALYIDRVEYNSRIADVDDELVRAEVAQTPPQQPAPATGPLPAPSGDVNPPVQLLVDTDGTVVSASGGDNPFDPAELKELAKLEGAHTVEDENVRVRISSADDSLVSITALSLDSVDDAVGSFRRALGGGSVVIIALVGVVIWMLTTALTRPVTRMATTATRIAGGELDTVIAHPSGSREMVALANDLDKMVAQLRTTLEASERSALTATKARDDMGRFLADLSHELRTPLTALKGYSDLYAGGMLAEPGDVDRAMSRIGSESDRLFRLANDMLQLARDEAIHEPTEPIDLAQVTAVVVQDLRAAYPDRHIELSTPHDDGPIIAATSGRIHQAILNLGSNACQHSGPDTPIEIIVDSNDHDAVLTVVDHGSGIDPADIERIFLPFFRVESSRSREGLGGAGLGLALVARIARAHHGDVVVSDTPGGGATFTLTFPLVDSGAANKAAGPDIA